jgi:Avidin family
MIGTTGTEVLQGSWENELGSVLVLKDDGRGTLRGSYRTATEPNGQVEYRVRGSYDVTAVGTCKVIGFVVDWGSHHALTAWSGRYDPRDETIRATWLMTTESDEQDEWRSTFVGHDTFRRCAASSFDATLL